MPTIAIVDGVRIVIYPNDHLPPHVHAQIAEYSCKMLIETGEVMQGDLPVSKIKSVQAWLALHHDDVSFAWNEVYTGRGIKGKIE